MVETVQRFYNKIDIESGGSNGCWDWTACTSIGRKGESKYGRFTVNRKTLKAHRFSYEHFTNAKIPVGMYVDHICKNMKCVRPDHLKLVTSKQNAVENSNSPSAINIIKTHCSCGHEYTAENTIYIKRVDGRYFRKCRICNKKKCLEYYYKKKAT